jgi:hypothetical protein
MGTQLRARSDIPGVAEAPPEEMPQECETIAEMSGKRQRAAGQRWPSPADIAQVNPRFNQTLKNNPAVTSRAAYRAY